MTRKSAKNAHLLVEGKNDQHVVWALCQMHQVPETFDVIVPGRDGGLDEVLTDIPVRLKEPGLQALGVVVDADEDLVARWTSVSERLRRAGYKVPNQPVAEGFIATPPGRPRLGVWLMPDNQLPGILENFVAYLIPDGDDLAPIADQTLDHIEQQGLARYRAADRPKAFIHTWLAWQDLPGRPMGQAITARVLRHDYELSQRFVAWLNKLFG